MSNLELTKKQEELVDAYCLEMLKNGVKCGIKTDRTAAEHIVKTLYAKDLDMPHGPEKIVFVDSPDAAIRIIVESEKIKPQEVVNHILFLNLWSWWVAYYHAGIHILGETQDVEKDLIDDLNEYESFIKQIHAIIPCEKVCFVIEYPKVISLVNNDLEVFKLHKEKGKAVEYQDGTGFCWLNGVEVPDWIAETDVDKLSVKKIIAETNVDIRREGLRRLPLEKVLKATKAKLLDQVKDLKKGKHWDYQLYDLDFGDGKKRVCLRMYDVASGAYPIERVDDNCKTVLDALAMRDGEDTYRAPSIRT